MTVNIPRVSMLQEVVFVIPAPLRADALFKPLNNSGGVTSGGDNSIHPSTNNNSNNNNNNNSNNNNAAHTPVRLPHSIALPVSLLVVRGIYAHAGTVGGVISPSHHLTISPHTYSLVY